MVRSVGKYYVYYALGVTMVFIGSMGLFTHEALRDQIFSLVGIQDSFFLGKIFSFLFMIGLLFAAQAICCAGMEYGHYCYSRSSREAIQEKKNSRRTKAVYGVLIAGVVLSIIPFVYWFSQEFRSGGLKLGTVLSFISSIAALNCLLWYHGYRFCWDVFPSLEKLVNPRVRGKMYDMSSFTVQKR